MQVKVISDSKQMFDGEMFYMCGNYFQHNGKRLHRTVWTYHKGVIPKGYHIHHKDGDRKNNQIENLELLSCHTHLSEHMQDEARKECAREQVNLIRGLASEWHHSEAGKAWHSIRGKENWKMRTTQTYICDYCGKTFQTKHIYGANQHHFCCSNHKCYFGRQRRKHESN